MIAGIYLELDIYSHFKFWIEIDSSRFLHDVQKIMDMRLIFSSSRITAVVYLTEIHHYSTIPVKKGDFATSKHCLCHDRLN